MRFPRPPVEEYVVPTVVVVVTLAVIEYLGIVGSEPGSIDWRFLLLVGLLFPVIRYLLAVVRDNIGHDIRGWS